MTRLSMTCITLMSSAMFTQSWQECTILRQDALTIAASDQSRAVSMSSTELSEGGGVGAVNHRIRSEPSHFLWSLF